MRLLARTASAPLAIALLVAALAAGAGCGGDKHMNPIVTPPPLPVGTPGASAPDSATVRWVTAYAVRADALAGGLLTSDYRYHFSAQSDPALAALYGDDWGKADEVTSLRHMRTGFTNSGGAFVPAVSALTFSLADSVVLDDAHPDSGAWYRQVDAAASFIVTVPSVDGSVTYSFTAPFHAELVRGDAAALASGQTPSAALWYLREIDDLSPPPVFAVRKAKGTASPAAAMSRTWGSLRSQYLQ